MPQQSNPAMIPSEERVLEQEIEDDPDDDSDYFPSDKEDVQPQVDIQRGQIVVVTLLPLASIHTSIEKALHSYADKGNAAIIA
jgi:hypothetical protein